MQTDTSAKSGVFIITVGACRAQSERSIRAPIIKQSLQTTDLVVTRSKRDLLEKADGELWAALIMGGDKDEARAKYDAALKRAEALGSGPIDFRIMS
ncbi:hypothetical protein ACLBWS_18735 [Brucellaceae bacterium D45D]